MIVFAVAAIVVGLLAAIFPARRAGKLNVLESAAVRVGAIPAPAMVLARA